MYFKMFCYFIIEKLSIGTYFQCTLYIEILNLLNTLLYFQFITTKVNKHLCILICWINDIVN